MFFLKNHVLLKIKQKNKLKSLRSGFTSKILKHDTAFVGSKSALLSVSGTVFDIKEGISQNFLVFLN